MKKLVFSFLTFLILFSVVGCGETKVKNSGKLSLDYVGSWYSNDADTLEIKKIAGDKITFDFGIVRLYQFEDLVAVMETEEKAKFNTKSIKDGFWDKIDGEVYFNEDNIKVRITKSECEYLPAGIEFEFSRDIPALLNEEEES